MLSTGKGHCPEQLMMVEGGGVNERGFNLNHGVMAMFCNYIISVSVCTTNSVDSIINCVLGSEIIFKRYS